jgi:four helix bundle protein
MPIEKFEDIKGWQEARILVRMVYVLTDEGKFAEGFGLRDQMRRAAVSVMAKKHPGYGTSKSQS